MRKYIIAIILMITTSCRSTITTRNIKPVKLTIATWNIQVLGKKKISNYNVMSVIYDKIKNCDIIAIQEERSKQPLCKKLSKQIYQATGVAFKCISSQRLGRGIVTRSISKERYIFLFKPSIKLKMALTYNDYSDLFEREPFIAIFTINKKQIAFVNIHTKPKQAKIEIKYLKQVAKFIIKSLKIQNIIILGDFNANDNVIRKTFKSSNILFQTKFKHFSSVKSKKLYDNIIIIGNTIKVESKSIETNGITPKVSDHYMLKATILVY